MQMSLFDEPISQSPEVTTDVIAGFELTQEELEHIKRLGNRDYQQDGILAAMNAFNQHSSTLIVLPTGTGKTMLGCSLCDVWRRRGTGRVLWIAHRSELIAQAAERIYKIAGIKPEIEKAESTANHYSFSSPFVVASVQSLNAGRKCKPCNGTGGVLVTCHDCGGTGRQTEAGDSYCETCEGNGKVASEEDCPHCLGGRIRRLQRYNPNDFSLIVTDEGHHADAGSYRRIYRWFRKNKNARFVGLTATPDRSDDASLAIAFESVACNYDMLWAIQNGWLVPVDQKSIECQHLDFSRIKTVAGDLNAKQLEELLTGETQMHEMVAPMVDIVGDRKTIVFCVDKMHTRLVCELINRYKGGSAEYILGDTPTEERERLLKEHKEGCFQYLVNCGICTEGYDDPSIQVVSVMRPTKSRSLYTQIVGRGTRPISPPWQDTPEERIAAIKASTKPSMLVLDFVGNSGKHKLISAVDILGGNVKPEVLDRAKQLAKTAGEENVTELIKRSQAEIEEEARLAEEERERLRLAEEARRAKIKADRAKYEAKTVDPFSFWDTIATKISEQKSQREATNQQIMTLKKMGLEDQVLENISFAQASVMLKTISERRQKGLCSYKQSKLLNRYGIDTRNMKFEHASAVITAIGRNGWRTNELIMNMAQQTGQ